MTLEVWTSQDALPTASSGTTDLAHGSVTTVPVAALHIAGAGIVNGTAVNNGRMGFGITDGANHRFATITVAHGITPTDCNHIQGDDAVMKHSFRLSPGVDGAISHNSFIAGGERVNNDDGFSGARLCNSMFFNCDTAKVMTAILSGTVDTPVNIDPGIAWDCAIMIGVPRIDGSANVEAEIYLGFYDETNQGCIMFNSDHGDAAADPSLRLSATYCGGEIFLGTGGLDYGILASLGAGNSLDLTPKSAGGDGDSVYVLFLGWTSAESVAVHGWPSPASTGCDAQTGVGFTPQAMLNLFSFANAVDTAEGDADAGAWGVGISSADDQFSCSIADDFNANPTNTQGLTNNKAIEVEKDNGAAGDIASLTSFDADGFTHNYTGVEGTVNRQMSLIFEVAAAGAGLGPRAMYHYRNHGTL